MKISDIDGGKSFDWGKTSEDYAKYRDIYPDFFYEKILERGVGLKGQKILDIGTGTGVLPRNMYSHGASWIGTDVAENQIAQAKSLPPGTAWTLNSIRALQKKSIIRKTRSMLLQPVSASGILITKS